MEKAHQMIQTPVVILILEILHKISRDHRSDRINVTDLLKFSMTDLLKIIIKMAADHLGISKANIGDSQTVDHSWSVVSFARLQAIDQIVIDFCPKPSISYDLFLYTC